AGSRRKWDGPDELRPLSKAGARQANALVAVIRRDLGKKRVHHVASSPFVRCVQSVEPLATTLGVAIEEVDALAEGTPAEDAVRVVEKFAGEHSVLCTHGDVVEHVLAHLREQGIDVSPFRFSKGSTWVLETKRGQITAARYIPRPR